MSATAQYVFSVIVIPALVAAAIALPFVLRPLRDRRVLAEAGVACALMAAFVASFLTELGWVPILRQFVTIEGDDAPFERWHRLATIAIGLGVAAWLIALARIGSAGSRVAVGIGAALLVALAIGFLVRFPGETLEMRLLLAGLAAATMFGFAGFARSVMLWASWIVFGVIAFLMGESGYAYLAVMSGAMSAGSFAVGALLWIGARLRSRSSEAAEGTGDGKPKSIDAAPRGIAVPIVLGALASAIAVSGRAYDQTGIPVGYWYCALLLPYMVLLGEIFIRPSVMRRRALLAFLAMLFGAGVMVGTYAWWRAAEASAASDPAETPSNGEESLDGYGG
ncbi:MAG: hypothetical protein RLY21_1229 [Planctomycetota bacterium]|jgi:hypothetical protein